MQRSFKAIISTLIMLPLFLPPTVLGFYMLQLMGPQGAIGKLTQLIHVNSLPFTFSGLVIGSLVFSLPFAVTPIQNAFEAIGKRPLEIAATLRSGYWDRFFCIALPLAKPGILTATVLTFAHTIGEFGVVLMIGGNIPEETRVISIAIYDSVEAVEYRVAHLLSGIMVLFSFMSLLVLNLFGSKIYKVSQ